MGFVAIGSSIGGTVIPITIKSLIGRVGYVQLIHLVPLN